ncbi:MAG: sigma-70 family RNA polymerase sigma factor [Planctomycetota bacterium]
MLAEPITDRDVSGPRGRRQALFLELLAEIAGDLEAYVRSLVPNRADGEDVLQDVCVTLWRKFEEFDFGTSFRKWAFSVAFHCCRGYWRDRKRRRGVALSDEALSKLGQLYEASQELAEVENRLLEACLGRLAAGDRGLVREVYFDGLSAGEAAATRGSSANAIYIRLSRIRAKLARCLDRRLT